MEITWVEISHKLGGLAIHSSLLATLAGGGMSIFKSWLISEDDASKKVSFLKQMVISKMSEALRSLLRAQLEQYQYAETLESEIDPKKLTASKIDPVDNYTDILSKGIAKCRKLDEAHWAIQRHYHGILLTTFAGIFLLLISLMESPLLPFITITAILLFFTQAISVLVIRKKRNDLVEFEHSI